MVGRRLLLAALLALSLASLGQSAGAGAAAPRLAGIEPVASLEPERTEAEWRRLVSTRGLRAQQQPGDCRPLRAVFYAATDFLRLATRLAAASSPCAEYYFSVPAIVGNRTQLRPNAANRIRALGPNFHALAEIHFSAWNRWVAETGNSWHTAGVTARERMAAAGYDVARGDSWALNELSTAVRRGDGNARANIREFLRGLYEGDGSRPTKGAVLVVGFGQRTSTLSLYQSTLQSWLTDSAFWTDMATYVSDWSQEVYGDVRAHAVPATPREVRREYLNDYLQHKLVLASAGPPEIEPARAFLREAYSPLANAAWERESGYGWTMVPVELMAAYASSQVEAMRFFSVTTRQARDHWGFAWAPRNGTGMAAGDFAERTGRLLDRIAAAIRDSASSDPESPGSGACGPPGQDLCAGDLAEARFNEAWRSFRTWTQPLLQFTTPPQTIVAGTPSAAIGLALVTSTGSPITAPQTIPVTISSSSPSGTFSLSPAGPWTSTLALSVSSASPVAFYYLDPRAGAHTLTASGPGATSGTQIVTVTAGPAARLELRPTASEVRARGSRRLAASAVDANGNATAATVTWRVSPPALGTIARAPGGAVTFTAGRMLRTGTVTATAGALTASASMTVTPARLRIGSLEVAATSRGLRVLAAAADGARRPVSRAAVTIVVRQGDRRVFRGRALTGSGGRALVRARVGRGCYTVSVTGVRAQGFVWDGRSRERRACRR